MNIFIRDKLVLLPYQLTIASSIHDKLMLLPNTLE